MAPWGVLPLPLLTHTVLLTLHPCPPLAADVLTIENSRSGDEMVRALSRAGYCRDLSPGVYDVHSPVVPPVEWFVEKIASYAATCEQFKVRAVRVSLSHPVWHSGVR